MSRLVGSNPILSAIGLAARSEPLRHAISMPIVRENRPGNWRVWPD